MIENEKNMRFADWCYEADGLCYWSECPDDLFERFKNVVREMVKLYDKQGEDRE